MMRAKNVFLFIVSSAIAFIAFAAIAMGIQATGLMMLDRQNTSESIPLAGATLVVPTPTFPSITEIDAQERAWLALGIDNYRIEVRPSFGTLGSAIVMIVHEGQIVEEFCAEEIYIAAHG